MATLYPHRLIFAAGAALDAPKITTSARVTPAGSAVTTAGFNPDLDTSSDFLVAINRRAYLRLTNPTAPESENLTMVPISSLFIEPAPDAPSPFPVAVFTGFSRILDVRVSQSETVFTIRIENYESIITFATKSTLLIDKPSVTARYASHVTPVPRERDDTVFLNEYQLRIPRWSYDEFRKNFKGYEFSEIGVQVDRSNNSPFPSDFPLDDVKIEQGVATAAQGVFRMTLLEYPHTARFKQIFPGVFEAVMRCRIEPREVYFRGNEDDLGTISVPAQEFRLLISIKEYQRFLVAFYAKGDRNKDGMVQQSGHGNPNDDITSADFRNIRVQSAQFGLGNSFSEVAGAGFDGYEYELLVDVERQHVPFIGFPQP